MLAKTFLPITRIRDPLFYLFFIPMYRLFMFMFILSESPDWSYNCYHNTPDDIMPRPSVRGIIAKSDDIYRRETCPPVTLNSLKIPRLIELHLDRRLNWRKHIFTKRKQFGIQLSKMAARQIATVHRK